MIVVRLQGGLGNQMFQYAAGRALAVRNGVPLKLDLTSLLDRTPRPGLTFRDYDLDVFILDAAIATPSDLRSFGHFLKPGTLSFRAAKAWRKIFPRTGQEQGYHFNPQFATFGPDAYLEGYWQSPKYFSEIESTIRKDFTFRPMPPDVQALAEEISQPGSVCVHVRRGDYVGNKKHETVGLAYYAEAVQVLSRKASIRKIYVFSDDGAWCEQNLSFAFPVQFVRDEYRGHKASGHLYLMTCCTHFVIPNSTFSWWGAWLSIQPGKIVIAPQSWFPDPSIDTSDLIPPEWIRI